MGNAIVTGAASGIGRAVREQLDAQGDRVIGIDLHDVEVNADLGTSEGRRRAIDETLALAGGAIDRLVLAAGLGGQVRDGLRVLSVNYFGSVDLLDAFKDAMVGRPGAAAVAVSSNAAQLGVDYNDPVVLALLDQDEAKARELFDDRDGGVGYCLSKHAIARAVRRRAMEWGRAGVRLNAVVPGQTDTPLYRAVCADPEMGQVVGQLPLPLGRTATAEEIAGIIVYLLSDATAYVHGSLLWADGGMDAAIRPDLF
jgi:NAD(P)-dependent dehydrogenase (short-subunit alcohol dehydrogenase family)